MTRHNTTYTQLKKRCDDIKNETTVNERRRTSKQSNKKKRQKNNQKNKNKKKERKKKRKEKVFYATDMLLDFSSNITFI